jgi:hypothetical protein
LVFAPPVDEDEVHSSHKDKSMVSYTPSQVFDSASFHDLESEEILEKSLDVTNFPSNEEHDDCINDFIHIGRCRWDNNCFHFDGDPIYDVNDGSRIKNAHLLPLEHTSMSIIDSDSWQYKDDMFTDLFQPSRSEPSQHEDF